MAFSLHASARMRRLVLRAVCGAALWMVCGTALRAVEPATPLANYGRQSWVMENGLPQDTVQVLAQTADGFVWLGTETGLARFDGVSFQTFERGSNPALPGSDIRSLLVARDGALWIGTGNGAARWKDGKAAAFTTQNGLPDNGVRELLETGGVVWAGTDLGWARFANGRFVPDGAGPLRGGTAFAARMPDGESATAAPGEIAIERGAAGVVRLRTGRELPGSRIQAMVADREGSLWIGTNSGLARWARGRLERLPVTDRLATASVLALMEDREGNLWVGTESDGLHIFRDQRFLNFGAREGLSSEATTAVTEGADGTLWVGTQSDGLNALRGGKTRHYTVRDGLASDVILALAAGPGGVLWAGTPDGLNRVEGGSVRTYTFADGLPDDFIRSLLVDGDGSLWIGTRHGLAHWRKGGATPEHLEIYTEAEGLGSDVVGAMARDARGDLWIATLAGVARLHAGRIENFTTARGLSSNVVTSLLPRADGTVLIGTQDHGWDVWDGRRFSAGRGGGTGQSTIYAILDDNRGHLWFATGDGIARCDVHAGGGQQTCSRWMEFGTADGLRSRDMATRAHPSAWRARDGRIWFATPKGLVAVDPEHFPVNLLPPPVALERFAIDDVDQPVDGGAQILKVKAGRVHFEFDYAAMSFIAPQKVRYRYMLEGFDRGWTEAGARRAAYYTNIPPGRYTFRVQAANNDGVWNESGAAFRFELERHFYQTLWFYALLLVAAALGIFALVRMRLRRAEGEFKAVLGERSRIAREIHDTLAQGYVGISAHLEVLAEFLRMGKAAEAAKHLDLIREYVREGLAEARQSIWALRTQDVREATLPVKLRRIAEAAEGDGLKVRYSTFGAYRPLPAEKEQEILRIAQEAIQNVKKHAGATELAVQLEFGVDTIALEVRDNGRGGVSDPESDELTGHYGLMGMRERAEAIGGSLEVSSVQDGGTAVRLRAAAPRMPVGEQN